VKTNLWCFWCCHDVITVEVHPVHLINVQQRQVAADPQIKPTHLGRDSAYRLIVSTPTVAIYYAYMQIHADVQSVVFIQAFVMLDGGGRAGWFVTVGVAAVSMMRIMSRYRFGPDDPAANPPRPMIRLGCGEEESAWEDRLVSAPGIRGG